MAETGIEDLLRGLAHLQDRDVVLWVLTGLTEVFRREGFDATTSVACADRVVTNMFDEIEDFKKQEAGNGAE
jgi:Cu2+-containing amine oxidase